MYVADREAPRKRLKYLIPQMKKMKKIFARKKIINFKHRLRIGHPIKVDLSARPTDQLLERDS